MREKERGSEGAKEMEEGKQKKGGRGVGRGLALVSLLLVLLF